MNECTKRVCVQLSYRCRIKQMIISILTITTIIVTIIITIIIISIITILKPST